MESPRGSRVYRTLLRLLPQRFRILYAEEMEDLFLEALGARRTGGGMAWLGTWIRAMADVVLLALRLRFPATRGRRRTPLPGGLTRSFLTDFRFAGRTLRRRPVFATVSILTLALGIGASTTMFSVVNGVLLEDLPFQEPDRLVAVWQTRPEMQDHPGDDGARWDRYRLTYTQYRDLAEGSAAYSGMAAYRAGAPDVTTLTGVGDPGELPAGAASASLLPLLGVRPVLGRWFLPEEEASRAGNDGAAVVVISHELWQDRFGGSPAAEGRPVTLDDRSFTVVGVLPAGFHLTWISASVAGEGSPERRDVWFPVGAPGWTASRWAYSWEVVGRLAPGVSMERALAETRAVLGEHVQSSGDARVLPRAAEETRGLAPPLLLLFGATALLLLIACGNIATLTTAELQGRRHEIATRSAMGAGSARIVRLFLSESLLLAVLGSLLGVALAHGGMEILVALAPAIPHLADVALDLRVLGFASLLTVVTAILFGSFPALLASRRSAAPLLAVGVRTSRAQEALSRAVMGGELALAVMLLVAGGLLGRSLYRLLEVDPGFDARGLAAVEVRLPESRYDRESSGAFFREALARVQAIPGIGSVTAVSRLPFPGSTSTMPFEVQGQSYGPLFYQVGPRYFETLDVPVLAGRSLDETIQPGGPLTIVVNETAARRFWPRSSAVGARVSLSFTQDPVTVVGVVGDMKRQVLTTDAEPAFYIPFSQLPDQNLCFLARTRMDASEAIPLMREAVVSLDRELVVRTATTLSALVEDSTRHERFRALLMNAFGLLATLLAAAGVIGVTARSVSLRTREMGIKLALGARRPKLVKETVGESLVVGLLGTAVGLLGALWATRLLSGFLFGIRAWDPLTYGAVAVFALVVCGLASYAPAQRISRVDPLKVLQAE